MEMRKRIPLALKLACTAFAAILVPYYWLTYSPWNFLYFCDMALLITLAALWLESSLLISLPAVGISVTQLIWVADLLTGSHIPEFTSYMFDPKLPLLVRGLSTFHGWLPFLLIWGVWRLGYDRRAFVGWTVLSAAVLLTCYLLAPSPPAPADNPNLAVNINFAHGLSSQKPQTWMPPMLWLTSIIVGFPLLLCLPAHLFYRSFAPKPVSSDTRIK